MIKKIFYSFIEWNFHQILDQHFKRKRGGVIIQLGANDGTTIDPVNFLIRKQKNRAILLEPLPQTFERLSETYKGNKTVLLLKMAIAEREDIESLPLYYLKQVEGIPFDVGHSHLSSFDWKHIEKHVGWMPGFKEMLAIENVPCISINKLIRNYAPDGVALLQIDVEGFDAKIILSMDFGLCKPDIIRFEHMHVGEEELKRCLSKLRSEGYRVYSYYGYHDTICIRPEIKTDILLRAVKIIKPKIFR